MNPIITGWNKLGRQEQYKVMFEHKDDFYCRLRRITQIAFILMTIAGIIALLTLIVAMDKAQAKELVDMRIIAKIESSENHRAYNPKDGGRGLYQITPIVLKDYNNCVLGKYGFSPEYFVKLEDLFNPKINSEVADWYLNERIPQLLKAHHIPVTKKNIIIAYNAGIANAKKGRTPSITKKYLAKYDKLSRRR